jgi:glycosyltransferase involved in cell wall biosynthesis
MELQPTRGVWIVIPAFNEATTLQGVIAGVQACGSVVVVDDASRDATGRIAAEAGVAVLRHPINLGQGAALQTGIDYALTRGAEVIVTFDADGQHRPGDVLRLVEALQRSHADFALGSRFLGNSQESVPPMRRLLLRAATIFTRMTTGLAVSDAHNGLRAMTARGARSIRLYQNRMAHASEILDQIAASGLPYVEVPVTIDYTRYSLAKGQRASDAVIILIDLFARRLQS